MPEEKTPNAEAIKEAVEKSNKFVDWVIEVLRGKNRTTKLLLLDALLFAVFNPVFFPKILELVGIKQLPNHYTLYFWLIIGAVFVAAVVAAWRARPKGKPFRDLRESRAIRGLLPYTKDDAALFARLQREQDLTECLQAVSDPVFRFGVLSGESGAGKSSFLQAGLWAEFEKRKLRCVYVKFSDLDPFESVRRACLKHLSLTSDEADTSDFLTLLDAAARQDSSPIVLLFDQFEQFFVHRKRKKDREPFVQALARWFAAMQSLPVKILLCIRGDFLDRLNELQKAMRYSLSPAQSFRLERFEPDQATEVFCFLAEKESLEYDRKFISEMTRQELADTEDGLISPVDIQVLAWMIAGQSAQDGRAFNRTTFQKLGGVDGLLERYLTRALAVRETEARRQAAIKVLLALTDLERNARAGALTLEALRQKLGGDISAAEMKEAVAWLARGDVRLISPSSESEEEKFELAHERLIPALRRLAGKELTETARVNQLLDRRANEWVGNNRSARYLLTWRELRSIKKQKPFMQWEPNRSGKESLIAASWRQIRLRFILASLPVLLAIAFASVWYSQWGQLQIIKWDVAKYSNQVTDSEALLQIAKSYVAIKWFDEAMEVLKKIEDPKSKLLVLCASVDELNRLGEKRQSLKVLQSLLDSLEATMNLAEKKEGNIWLGTPSVLRAISTSAGRLGDRKLAEGPLNKVLELAHRINIDHMRAFAFLAIAESWLKVGDRQKADDLLRQSHELVQKVDAGVKDSSLLLVVTYQGKFAEETRDARLLEQAKQTVEEIKEKTFRNSAWNRIIYSSVRLAETNSQRDLLVLSRQYVEKIERGSFDIEALCAISESAAKLGDKELSKDVFKQALQIVEKSKSASE